MFGIYWRLSLSSRKHLFFIFLLFTLSSSIFADDTIYVQGFDTKLGKEAIYDQAMICIANIYLSPADVLQYYNKEQGIIIVNNIEKIHVGYVDYILKYNLTINITNNHYKIEMKLIGSKIHENDNFNNFLSGDVKQGVTKRAKDIITVITNCIDSEKNPFL